jgi:hypothetical protein
MSRDLELIRKLLFFFDAKPTPIHVTMDQLKSEGFAAYEDATLGYHLVLLYDAGCIRAEPMKTSTGRVYMVLPFELTWEGHELLDKIRNQFIWDEVLNTAKEKGFVNASVDVLKKLADAAIRRRLGID